MYHSLFLTKNVYVKHFFFLLELSHASNNTTSPNIGGTDAWAVPTSKFWGTVPQSPLGLRPWSWPPCMNFS